MLNWKKEGYEVGKEVYIVETLGYQGKKVSRIGKATYVGTKNMTVSLIENNKEKILKFNGRRFAKGFCFGYYYEVYKSEEDYKQMIIEEEKANEAIDFISENLKSLSLDKLEAIKLIIENA